MKNMIKSILPILLCGISVFSLSGCAKQRSDTIRIGVMYSTDIIPLAIVQEQALDKKYDFKLDMQVFSSAKDRDAALQAGELDAVYTDYIGVCIYQNAGLDVKITGETDGDYMFMAGKNSGIDTLADASGSSIAISENTLIDYTLDCILQSNGYASDYLRKELVPRIPDRLEMLRGEKVELGLFPDPFAATALSDGAKLLGSANAIGLYPAVSAFTQESIDKKNDTIARFYIAYNEAIEYINTTPIAEFEDTIIDIAGYPEELRGKIKLPTFRKNTLPSQADLSNAIQWASAKGLCKAELTPAQLLGKLD